MKHGAKAYRALKLFDDDMNVQAGGLFGLLHGMTGGVHGGPSL